MDFLLSFKLPKILKTISKIVTEHNAHLLIVGGCVRDYFLKLPIKDYDVEVYGLGSLEELEQILASFGSVNLVGKNFGVLKFQYEGDAYDFSFPRTESKTGVGHKDFDIVVDGSLDYHVAFKRRDFTINAMAYHVEKGEFIDPFHGLEDLKKRRLQHIDDITFVEDPLRVYRAVQFCARFDFGLAKNSFSLCQRMVKNRELDSLAKERVYEEFKKLLLKSSKPSVGFELMRELGVLHYFPELEVQKKSFWKNSMKSLDSMVSLLGDNTKDNVVLMFAILCHNLDSLELSKTFLLRITDEKSLIQRVLSLVKHCKKPTQLYDANAKESEIRRLATEVNIQELLLVAKADFLAQEPSKGVYHAGEWLHDKAVSLGVLTKPLDNILQGKDLIKLGLKPSPLFTKILDDVYELQLSGDITSYTDAISYVKS